MLKDSSKAVPTMEKGNIPFGEADLAAIVLSSVSMWWQNQYNLKKYARYYVTESVTL